MKRQYRISPKGSGRQPSEADISRYKDLARLQHNYAKAKEQLHHKPIYKDRRAFFVLLVIVLVAWLLSEIDSQHPQHTPERSGTGKTK